MLGFGVIWWSIATAFTPLAASLGLPALLFARACMGVGEGVAMPAMNNLLSRCSATAGPLMSAVCPMTALLRCVLLIAAQHGKVRQALYGLILRSCPSLNPSTVTSRAPLHTAG